MNISIHLPTELTIYTVAELHPQWLAAATSAQAAGGNDDEHCNVEASQVQEVDTAGLQLLLSLSGLIQRQRRSLHVVNASEALQRACAALGTTALLQPQETAEVKS
jgi:ABC-type transporter Mla MlaB component